MDSKSVSHTKWKCQYHIIYRKIPEEAIIWKAERRCKRSYQNTIYDKHPELQSRRSKAFRARGYYVATAGNLTEEAIKKYIQEQSEEIRKEESEGAAF